MGKMNRADAVLQLLEARNPRMDARLGADIRAKAKAKLWAREIYDRLLRALCQDNSLDIFEDRFVLIERLNSSQPEGYERLQLNELAELLDIKPGRFQTAIEIKRVQCETKHWYAAALVLDKLKHLLQEP
jgi:hypothetical protein